MPDSAVFQAKYPGQCGRCDNRIQVGEHVHYDDDELIHVECAEDIGLNNNVGTPCPDCWLIHKGECP